MGLNAVREGRQVGGVGARGTDAPRVDPEASGAPIASHQHPTSNQPYI